MVRVVKELPPRDEWVMPRVWSECDLERLARIRTEYEPIEEERVQFLRTRPWYRRYHAQLQELVSEYLPGTYVVAPDDDEDYVDTCRLLRGEGQPLLRVPEGDDEIVLMQMKRGACHHNCAQLLRRQRIAKIVSGWALDRVRSEPLWRYHSWGVDTQGRIVETSVPMQVYVGCDYTPPPDTKLRYS